MYSGLDCSPYFVQMLIISCFLFYTSLCRDRHPGVFNVTLSLCLLRVVFERDHDPWGSQGPATKCLLKSGLFCSSYLCFSAKGLLYFPGHTSCTLFSVGMTQRVRSILFQDFMLLCHPLDYSVNILMPEKKSLKPKRNGIYHYSKI